MSTTIGGVIPTGGTNYGNTVFTDKKMQELNSQSFLELMATQLSNQDFMNPVDDTQFLAQMAQFTTMQQTQEMANLFKQSYVLSLVGQNITAAKFTVSGDVDSVTGPVSKVSLVDNEYLVYVGNKSFNLDQIMSLNADGTTDGGLSEEDQEMFVTDYSQRNFLLSLIGKMVTAKSDSMNLISGIVERVSMDGLRFLIGDQWYTLDSLQSIDISSNGQGISSEIEGV